MKYQRPNADGTALEPSPIDAAIDTHIVEALCETPATIGPRSRTAEKAALPDGLRGVDLTTGSRFVAP